VAARHVVLARSLQAQHPSWVFAGPTAALLHRLEIGYANLGDIWVASSSFVRTQRGMKRICVDNDKTTERDGIRVTSFLRTVYDCLRLFPFEDALAVADSALRMHQISADRLQANLRIACGGKPGVRHALSIVSFADGRAENGGESRARAGMISLGFAIPDLQRELCDPVDGSHIWRVDFAWDLSTGGVVYGELDGRDKYTDVGMTHGKDIDQVLLAERRREAHITLVQPGVRIMRFSMNEVRNKAAFSHLMETYGVPRAIAIPEVAALQ
jgi:hypothetical protein